jgi:hypothetical protein
LLLHAPHLAGPDIPPLAPGIAQDPLLHNLFSEALEQAILRLTITQSDCCQPRSPPSRRPYFLRCPLFGGTAGHKKNRLPAHRVSWQPGGTTDRFPQPRSSIRNLGPNIGRHSSVHTIVALLNGMTWPPARLRLPPARNKPAYYSRFLSDRQIKTGVKSDGGCSSTLDHSL